MFRIVSLMAQEITVCASIKECLITVFFPLSNGKSDRTLWKMFSDSSNNVDNPLFCKISIFSTLQDKCAKSQIIAFLAFAWKQDEWQKDLKEFGCYMGKFIYIMDAYEDIGDDVKKKSYNPLIQLMHCCNNDQEKFDKSCRLMMTSMLSEAAKIFERLPILLHADIIRNVLYSGVWSKYEYIQMKKRKKHK